MNEKELFSQLPDEEKQKLVDALRKTSSPEEVKEVFAKAGIALTDKEIREYSGNHPKDQTELTDDALEKISGGSFYGYHEYRSAADVTFVAEIGQILEVDSGWGFGTTVRCRVTDRKIEQDAVKGGVMLPSTQYIFYDMYYVVPLEEHWYFSGGWVYRSAIEK